MEMLFEWNEIENGKTRDLFPLKCRLCNEVFYKAKRNILQAIKLRKTNKNDKHGWYCGTECRYKGSIKRQLVNCQECNKQFYKQLYAIIKTKNNFCSKSCAATYNNKNKKYGTRKSKFECWLEEKLPQEYLNLEFIFNGKEIIQSELDIYIPSLKLAFEIQGIVHYQPIYGQDKFEQIQKNDCKKADACKKNNILLYPIDVSSMTYCIPKNFESYKKIIDKIICQRQGSNLQT